ncbi:MAG: HlyC/CorC family transporter [Bacteroidales bacterium]|jgi:CBS domain containing-hemolysin-like protein|nr:HlyC/CorC family transporter [Bacteroidales bacterium]
MNAILTIIIVMIFTSFFSGMEIAFVASNKLRIELDKKQGQFGSKLISFFTENPGQYFATMLIGNNIALVIFGLIISRLLSPVLMPLLQSDIAVIIVNTVISTALILLMSEFLPKTVFMISPNFFLNILSLPAMFFYVIFYPVSKLTLAVSNLFLRLFFGIKGNKKDQENLVFSKVDFSNFLNEDRQSTGSAEPLKENIRIFRNALDFSNVKLRECMVPRTEIVAIEAGSKVQDLKERFIQTGHSRILVYQNTIDNIIGYFELKDMFKDPPDIMSCVRKLAIVPETMTANKLLKLFFDERMNVALVVDEFGGTSGMVTIEDVLEEIVGDIEDEHDYYELTEKEIAPGEFVFSGRLEIDYLNETYNLNLPEEDDYETLAGLILYHNGSIPVVNETINIGKFVFRVIKVTATRIELVNLKTESG